MHTELIIKIRYSLSLSAHTQEFYTLVIFIYTLYILFFRSLHSVGSNAYSVSGSLVSFVGLQPTSLSFLPLVGFQPTSLYRRITHTKQYLSSCKVPVNRTKPYSISVPVNEGMRVSAYES